MEPVPWGPAEGDAQRTKRPKSLVGLQNPLSLPKQTGGWAGQGSSRALELPRCLSRKDGRGCAPGFGEKECPGSRQPSGTALHGFDILPRTPAAFLPRGWGTAAARVEPPPQLLRCSSCLPDNIRVLGGLRRLTSYKTFVNRISPVARR